MIRLMHAADLHLDSPFAALAPEQAARRRIEQREMVRNLTEECESRRCDLLLLSGDVFDSDHVYRETAEMLRDSLQNLQAQVFIAPGNHDPYSPLSPYATLSWPENVHIFRSRFVETIRLEKPAVNVCGAAFTEPRETGLLKDYKAPADDRPTVMVIHGVLGDETSVYNPIPERTISASGLDYLALGHVHKHEVRQAGRTIVGNPGFTLGRGFDETGPGHALYVEIDNGVRKVESIELAGRIYQTIAVNVSGDPLAAVEKQLPHDTKNDIYRIILTGTCATPDLAFLHKTLAHRFFSLELVDKTLPPQEIWKDVEEDSLKGEFLRQLKSCYDAAEASEEDRRLIARAVSLGLALMEGREVPEI